MLSYFDALLIFFSIIIFVGGIKQNRNLWLQGNTGGPKTGFRIKRVLSVCQYLLSHHQIRKDRSKGISHLFVFWGFLFPLGIIIISQFNPHTHIWVARSLSLVLDLLGTLAVVGAVWLVLKKYSPRDNQTPMLHLILLLAIFLTGFFTEAVRLKITAPLPMMNVIFAPIGYGLSFIVPASPVLHKLLIRSHFFLVLIFIACIPYTNMRHAFTSLINIYYRKDKLSGQIMPIVIEGESFGAGKITDFAQKDLLDAQACVSCGRCDLLCPAYIAEQPLSPLMVLKEMRAEMKIAHFMNPVRENLTIHEDIWSCTTCLNCVHNCPIAIDQLDKIIQLRQYAVLTKSNFPREYKTLFRNIEVFGDSLGSGRLLREEWTSQLKITRFSQNSDIDTLLWVGCIASLYSERSRRILKAAANILAKSGFRYAILGKEELCCGDPARRLGNEYLFQLMAKKNIEIFNRIGVKKIITFCPHCFHTLKNEYAAFGMKIEVTHAVELIDKMIADGSLIIRARLKNQMTYHDPCYLGRYNSMYQVPRNILKSVLDGNLKEMPHTRDKSICCGAGGGNFWKGKITGRRIEKMRFEEAQKSQADGIITACPFCTLMFESAHQQHEAEKPFKILDILEIVDHAT